MREKMIRFMMGRYGVDELSRMLSVLTIICLVVDMITRTGIFSLIGLGILVYMYFRVFSKNIAKRSAENQKYRNFRYRFVASINKGKTHLKQRKTYKFFRCPTCKQKVRVPKGHGKVEISCPKCREKFQRRT